MNILALDCETTTSNNGDPFDTRNHFVLGGYTDGTNYTYFNRNIHIPCIDTLVLFNAKFDLHWLRNLGIVIPTETFIWDCQLAEYILSNQQWRYPSLDEACERRGLGKKIDVVKEQYWNKGIDTSNIPIEILTEYLQQDLNLTYKLYEAQIAAFHTAEHRDKYRLFRLHCRDLVVLEEMEYNGYKYDCKGSLDAAKLLEEKSLLINESILSKLDNVPVNLSSPNHISCLLYGGDITEKTHVPVGVYKTGNKVGHTRYKIVESTYKLPKLIEPLKGTELAKEGYYKTDEDTLINLRATGRTKEIIDALLERRGIEKLRGTYYEGLPKLIEEHSWANSLIHGSLNQCVTVTGRLSATKPNQQNMTKEVKNFCISRYT